MKTDENCLFCKIIKGDIPCEKVFENKNILGFKDISPMAAIHYLFIHKSHTKDFIEMIETDKDQLLDILDAIKEFRMEHEEFKSFRIVSNVGAESGQSVFHTHFHLLSGERLRGFGS